MEDQDIELEPRKAGDSTPGTLWEKGDENQRLLTSAYLVLAGLCWFLFGAFFEFLISRGVAQFFSDSSLAITLERAPVSPGYLVGFVAAALMVVFLRRHAVANQFGLETISELRKVTWPARDATFKSTIAVIITVMLCAVILGIFDWVWRSIATKFLL